MASFNSRWWLRSTAPKSYWILACHKG